MKLRELLDARRVIVPLKARSVRDATRQLAKSLVASGAVRDEMRLTELLKSEWPEDIVSVAGRAFLPHFRTDAAAGLALAMGIATDPLCLPGDPNRCARIVVLIIAPTEMASEYLRAMSAVATALAGDESLAALHAAQTADEVLAISSFGDAVVPPEVTVGDLMSTSLASIGPDTVLREAAQLMFTRNVRAVPVIGPAGEVLGLLNDGHLLRHLLPQTVSQLGSGPYRAAKRPAKVGRTTPMPPGEVTAREVMDRTVLCLSEDQSIADVAALMLSKSADRFPVTRDGALVGFLTRGDIVRKLLGA
ncbi:MAG TPA: CBS domain-containing protein [Gemmatimonadales bacterium]|jgi:CBS domain-containing protein/mannitol/fructose-specific phosphotransferase system IIA component (Ntr-type)